MASCSRRHLRFKETFSPFQGTLELGITENDGTLYLHELEDQAVFEPTYPFITYFAPEVSGELIGLHVKNIAGASPAQNPGVTLSLLELGADQSLEERVMVPLETSGPGALQYELSEPISLTQDIEYQLRINPPSQGGRLALSPDVVLNEGDWDDGLPLRMDGYDPFGGIYPPDVNLNIVYEDTPDKRARRKS